MTLLDDLRELAAELRIGGDEFAAVRIEAVLAKHDPPPRHDARLPLTKRQQQALDFIVARLRDHGYPPTLREIADHMGIRSTNGVHDHLKALEAKGYLVREELKSRALRPVNYP